MRHIGIWSFMALVVAMTGGVLGFLLFGSAALAPRDLIVRTIEPGTVSLDWKDVPGASGYELRYQDSEWIILPYGAVSVTMEGSSAVVRSLPSGSDFAFAVRTRAAGGYRSNWSNPVYSVPLPAREPPVRVAPATPGNLKMVKRERDAVVLEWQAVTSADSYQVAYWRTSEEGEDWVILPDEDIHVSNDTSGGIGAVVSRLPEQPARIHDLAVRAVNAAGVSDWSDVVQVPVYLQTPQDLFGWFQAPGQVILVWREVPAADRYEILFRHNLETDSEEWVILPTDSIEVSLVGSQAVVDLGPNHTDRLLYFSVRAIADLFQSPWSSEVAVGPILQVPAELRGVLLEDGAISLDWSDVPDVDAYEVRFLLGGSFGSEWVTLPALGIEVSLEGSGARLEQVPYYAAYSFQVRATNEYSLPSDWSEVFALARQTRRPEITVQATHVESTPSATSAALTGPPADSEASRQTGPSSGGGLFGGTGTSATGAEDRATPTPRDGSDDRSQPEPAPRPRVWLQNTPTTLKKGEWKRMSARGVGIAAARDIVASVVINYEGAGKVAFSFNEDGKDLETASAACGGQSDNPAAFQKNFVRRGMGVFTFHIAGCDVGPTKILLEVSRFTGAGSSSQVWRFKDEITVVTGD